MLKKEVMLCLFKCILIDIIIIFLVNKIVASPVVEYE